MLGSSLFASSAAQRAVVQSAVYANRVGVTTASRRLLSVLPPTIPESELRPKDPTGESPVRAYETSGVPPEVTSRTVRIYKPCKTAMQSGVANTTRWKLDFDTQDRWENQLMGWISSGDPVQMTRVTFETKEQAVDFATRHGYRFWVDEPAPKVFKPKEYAENFRYEPDHLRIIRTK